MHYIKSTEWLNERLNNVNIRVIDCRFSLTDRSYGQRTFKKDHIPGAVFFDLEKDLSGPVQEHGGRHPLPDLSVFKHKLELAGINNRTIVVAYDDGEGSFASRFWWLLTYIGHDQVYVLDGGLKKWKDAGYPITSHTMKYEETVFSIFENKHMLATYLEVKQRSADKQAVLIDSRAKERYLGLTEPMDKRPGHIPGAINKVWTEGFKDGKWKSKQDQIARFTELDHSTEIIVYCGSGVTATPNILNLMSAGFENVKLYAGSYSDWVSYDENPVEGITDKTEP
ncbi:sulfurtransferase [Lederbergia lenta]|uniref:Thiosulfate sulfurtransferase n=1 Tax=Lederbergia lenta TaxID=1467 RepID=A0A2X4W0N7_LEDLE|nr:sulfurtransferase [Lederbergia lenta]MCM3109326.1 sulfurtransferase [Lederbergia lenta]MEC2324908.1 sulfurtransferase [Lederbergia lenta]SQI56651.1 thiosulfate sulfurtransferase [Lederbergia lenta]